MLLHPLPVAGPDRLVELDGYFNTRSGRASRLTTAHLYPTVIGVRDSGAFDGVAAGGLEARYVRENGQAQARDVFFATGNFFDLLGVPMALGPGFGPENDRPDAPLTVVVSYRYWQRLLGADPAVIGRTIVIEKATATIVGVAARRFRGLNLTTTPDLYVPLHAMRAVSDPHANYFSEPTEGGMSSPYSWLTTIGRVKADATAADTLGRLNALPVEVRHGHTFVLTPINIAALPEAARAGLKEFARLLSITVGLLLLIAGLTVGMLLLIRTEARQHEFAMCLALGASRRRLATGVATEGALLAVAGAVVAVPIAWMLFRALGAFQLPGRVEIEQLDLQLGGSVFAASVTGAVGVTLLIALVASVFGFSASMADVLRTRAGSAAPSSRRLTRSVLVAGQVAVTLVLLAGAGLFARSLIAALQLNPGFEPDKLALGSLSVTPYGYTEPRAIAFFDKLRERLAHNPAIESAAVMLQRGGMSTGGKIPIDGEPRQFPTLVAYASVDDQYFKTMRQRILAGRDFTSDDGESAPLVVIVSESLGRLIADGQDPIGHRITETSSRRGQPPGLAEIVGVVPDVVTSVTVLEPLVIYSPLAQRAGGGGRTLVVRARSHATAAIGETHLTIKAIDQAVTPPAMLTMQERISRQMGPQQFGALVLGVLGGIAVLLTILGAYVLAESMAAIRQREMGIRAALGANRGTLGGLLLWQTARLVGLGLAIGLVLAWLGASTIRAFLFQVQPFDPTTLAGVSATILALSLAVSLRPALAATRVDLAKLLREE